MMFTATKLMGMGVGMRVPALTDLAAARFCVQINVNLCQPSRDFRLSKKWQARVPKRLALQSPIVLT